MQRNILIAIYRASEMLLLVQPGPAVLARLPDLRAGVKDHLRVSDPRFDVFTRVIDAAERRAGLLPAEKPSTEGGTVVPERRGARRQGSPPDSS